MITRYQRHLPDVLSIAEVARLLAAAPSIKYKAALGVAYRAGLHVSEVVHLKVKDIDSARMLIRVEEGIRHYGLLAAATREDSPQNRRELGLRSDCLAQVRDMLAVAPAPKEPEPVETSDQRPPCPCCSGTMVIIETFTAWCQPRAPPTGRTLTRENHP